MRRSILLSAFFFSLTLHHFLLPSSAVRALILALIFSLCCSACIACVDRARLSFVRGARLPVVGKTPSFRVRFGPLVQSVSSRFSVIFLVIIAAFSSRDFLFAFCLCLFALVHPPFRQRLTHVIRSKVFHGLYLLL